MFSADFNVPGWGTGWALPAPYVAAENGDEPPAAQSSSGDMFTPTGSFWDFMASEWGPGSQRHLVDPTGPLLPPVTVGTGRSQEGDIIDEAAAVAAAAAAAAAEIPGAIGEAGGELVAGLGAGVGSGVESVLTGVTAPITAIPGALFEGIPSWVPLLGAAYLLSRQ